MTSSPPPPSPSALSSLIAASNNPPTPHSATTTQILHNLQHQHLWTSLEAHPLTLPQPQSNAQSQFQSQPQPEAKHEHEPEPEPETIYLISGTPPNRVYTHPDEQLYMLEKGLRDEDMPPEQLTVLPLAQGQKWSLRRLAAIFDSLPNNDTGLDWSLGDDDSDGKADKLAEYYERRKIARRTREWGGKKILLAMLDKGMGGDGTVVYYVVQEGAVKPRQN